jgi:hypothetical protein
MIDFESFFQEIMAKYTEPEMKKCEEQLRRYLERINKPIESSISDTPNVFRFIRYPRFALPDEENK